MQIVEHVAIAGRGAAKRRGPGGKHLGGSGGGVRLESVQRHVLGHPFAEVKETAADCVPHHGALCRGGGRGVSERDGIIQGVASENSDEKMKLDEAIKVLRTERAHAADTGHMPTRHTQST